MPLGVSKQGKESTQNLVRRFTQKLRKSGILFEVRRRQFRKKSRSKPLVKRSALRRIIKQQEYIEMRKMGFSPPAKKGRR
ncbi:MAG: hypothetical protein PHW31_02810 [Candidatus Pacebacteria bacterium]|nr:hypothetical protein [Candidatus Paceibacterota bacterium]